MGALLWRLWIGWRQAGWMCSLEWEGITALKDVLTVKRVTHQHKYVSKFFALDPLLPCDIMPPLAPSSLLLCHHYNLSYLVSQPHTLILT